MNLSRKTKKDWRLVLAITLVAALFGFVYSVLRMVSGLMPPTFLELEHAIRSALTIGFFLGLFMIFFIYDQRGTGIRRRGFVAGWLIIDLISTVIIAGSMIVQRLVTSLFYYRDLSYFNAYFRNDLLIDVCVAFMVFLIIVFVLQVRRLVGEGTMWKVITGRYHEPQQENRIFMFLDIKGSTSIAERLGDKKTHAFITDVFFDADRLITEHHGEILNYNGDELVASWPEENGLKQARCLSCYAAIVARLKKNEGHYLAEYGVNPELWAGLHTGPVVVGECGDSKLAIVHIGDTPNTAARLEHKAKELGHKCLVSGALMDAIELPKTLVKKALDPIILRGHSHETKIYAVSPRATG